MTQPYQTEKQPAEEQRSVSFFINGQAKELFIEPSRRLSEILRYDLQMTGTKVSCEIGRCGACIVLVDGAPFNSCLTMAYQCEGKQIETIESMDETDEVCSAFLEEGALQCGYCTPGMVMSLKGLLKDNENPTVAEMQEGLSGNICRCTGYGGINRVLHRLEKEKGAG